MNVKKICGILIVILFALIVLVFSACGEKDDAVSDREIEAQTEAMQEEEEEEVVVEIIGFENGSTGLSIGDKGPAGGIIFYINPNAEEDGWEYMEMAPLVTMWEGKAHGGRGLAVGEPAQNKEIGAGLDNTLAIYATYGDNEPYQDFDDYAAKLCLELIIQVNGDIFEDWFLPSKHEMGALINNLYFRGLIDLSDGRYWTSTEDSTNFSWAQVIGTRMGLTEVNKFTPAFVIAVRRF